MGDPEYGEGIDCDACRGTGKKCNATGQDPEYGEGNEPYRSYTLQEKPFHFTVIGNKSIVPDITNPEGYPIGIFDETAKLACQYGRTKASYVMIPTKDLRFKNTKNEWMPFAEHCTECGQIFTPDQPDADQCSNQKCGNEGEGWKDLNELGETINELLYPARRRRLGAECPHGGILGTGKFCCACQSKGLKKCEGHKGLTMGLAGLNYCDSNCDDCECSQTATTDTFSDSFSSSQVYEIGNATSDAEIGTLKGQGLSRRNPAHTQTARHRWGYAKNILEEVMDAERKYIGTRMSALGKKVNAMINAGAIATHVVLTLTTWNKFANMATAASPTRSPTAPSARDRAKLARGSFGNPVRTASESGRCVTRLSSFP